jgi:hypothetical protein
LLNGDLGFERYSQIEFLALGASYAPARRKFRIEEALLLDITSLFPWDAYDRKLSWAARIGSEEARKEDCDGCHRQIAEGGAGISFHGFGGQDLWYALALARAAYASRQEPHHWDLGPGLRGGLLLRLSPLLRARAEARGEWDLLRSFERPWSWTYSLAQAYGFSQNWETRAEWELTDRPERDEALYRLSLTRFF